MAFHYHHFQFNDQGGNVGMKGLKKMGSQKINDIANDTFIFHSLRIFFLTEHLEHIASQHEDEIVKNKDYDISGGVISSYVRKCIIDANV